MSKAPFNVLYLGAGFINWGHPEGPTVWNHSIRVESVLGERLNVVGLIDIDVSKAEKIIAEKRQAQRPGYLHTRVFSSIQAAGEALNGEFVPALAILGLPPQVHGSTIPGRDAELQLVKHFPNVGLFIEKPISSDPNFENIDSIARRFSELNSITGVGYMFRYSKVVREMKQVSYLPSQIVVLIGVRRLLKENRLSVMATQARYLMPYKYPGTHQDRIAVWDMTKWPGPIVEQATHICDLMRFFTPNVNLSSVSVHTVEHTDPAGKLSQLTIDLSSVPDAAMIPRVTAAIWRDKNGAIGSMLHGIVPHDGVFPVEVVIMADGWVMRLVEPYDRVGSSLVRGLLRSISGKCKEYP